MPDKVAPIPLPEPRTDSDISVEKTLTMRTSIREFKKTSLTLSQVGQLLWAAQGMNRPEGHRTTPSAGALYPLELLLMAGEVEDLDPGLYRYTPEEHHLIPLLKGDLRKDIATASLDQAWVREGPAILILTAIYERTTGKYGQRGYRYVHMEVGAASQNLHLQAAAMGLGTVAVGAFHDDKVNALLHLPNDEHPLLIMPIGKPH
ncbi:MAG: SagB/ThcOx family dehydrogenase [Fidelibacterota bacterium]|nr:MAG: SagB/ThcOx family dehydrogenase [Candidatus Neomarinimicrobiota bacterium]